MNEQFFFFFFLSGCSLYREGGGTNSVWTYPTEAEVLHVQTQVCSLIPRPSTHAGVERGLGMRCMCRGPGNETQIVGA